MTARPKPGAQPSPAWAFFYPVAALVAAGVILLSFGPTPFARPGEAVRAQPVGAALALGPAALAEATPDAHHVVHVVRAQAGAPAALRLAVKPGASEAAAQSPTGGATLALAPETGAALSGKANTVTITLRPILNTPAEALAVRLIGDGETAWTAAVIPAPEPLPGAPALVGSAPVADDSPRTLTLTLPAVANVRALAVRAVSARTDLACGVEITAITFAPTQDRTPAPLP